MSVLNFPVNPKQGDVYDHPPYRYIYDDQKWKSVGRGADTILESIKTHEAANNVHGINSVQGLQTELDKIGTKLPTAEVETTGDLVMRVNGPRDQQISNALANTTGGAYISDTAPANPFQGMRWFDTTIGRTFIYYIDNISGQWVEENPQSPDWLTTSPVLNGIAHETTMLSHRNLLINGGFYVDQRYRDGGVIVQSSQKIYVVDRWLGYAYGGPFEFRRVSMRQWNGTIRNAILCNPQFTGTGQFALEQRIEHQNCNFPTGGSLTLSIWVHTESPDLRLTCNFITAGQWDDYSNTVVEASQSQNVPKGIWTKLYFKCPTTSIRAGYGMMIDLNFAGTFTSQFSTHVAEIQLEVGDVATPFEHRPYSYELSLCQRYFETGMLSATGDGVIGYVQSSCSFSVHKRVSPTLTVRDNTGAANACTVDATHGIPAAVNGDHRFVRCYINNRVIGVNTFAYFNWTADAEL